MGIADLRPNVAPDAALDRLRELATQAGNVPGGGLSEVRQARDKYLQWVEVAEGQLGSVFSDSATWVDLYTDHYWQIRSLDKGSARPYPLIGDETRRQIARLESIAEIVRHRIAVAALPANAVAVIVDTSVVMNYLPFDQIDWCLLAGGQDALLVMPMLVIDELDDLKFRARPTAKRATTRIARLREDRRGLMPHEASAVRRGVTLRILMDPARHRRQMNNDEEILDRAEQMAAYTQGRAFLATGDYGMELRATTRGLRCLDLPGALRLASTIEEPPTAAGTT